jgi:hypothetical protein
MAADLRHTAHDIPFRQHPFDETFFILNQNCADSVVEQNLGSACNGFINFYRYYVIPFGG